MQFRTSIIEKFDIAAQRISYYNQYLNLKQTSHQSVDNYANRFIKLRMKVDRNNAMLAEQIVLKFVKGLKLQIMFLVYVKNPQILDAAVIITRNVEGRLVIANKSKQVYTLEDQIIQLSE